MTKAQAYDVLDKELTSLAEDYWDNETDEKTLRASIGYLLGFSDGIRQELESEAKKND